MCGLIASVSELDELDPQSPHSIDLKLLINKLDYRGIRGYKGYRGERRRNERSFAPEIVQFAHTSLPFTSMKREDAIQPQKGSQLVFVGEIFNYDSEKFSNDVAELNNEFQLSLVRDFHDYLHSRDGFWSFVGMRNDNLVGYTDFLGIKPLYYRTDMEAFASEPDVLKHLGPVTPNEIFLSNVLKWGYDPRPETPWNEIKQVPPGCYVENNIVKPYWDWAKVKITNLPNDLQESVKNRLGGLREVPILLSGGLDSSIIYKIMKKLGRTGINCIHVENNESWFAENVIAEDDKMHYVTLDDDYDDDTQIKVAQTPVDLGSTKQQYLMGKKLKGLGFNAVMTGDGADELFGGYRRSAQYDSQCSDVFCELPYYHLPKIDRTMMRSTVEVRCPFLSPKVIKHALELPYKKRNGIKHVLKTIASGLVPEVVINREKLPLKTKEIAEDPLSVRIEMVKKWRDYYGI